MICDNSFCAASYSKETRGKKPTSKTIPPEIDNTANLSYLLNLDDEADQCNDDVYVLTKRHLPPQRIRLLAPFHDDITLPWPSISISKWQCDSAGRSQQKRSVTICWQLLFQLNNMRSRIWNQVLDEETVW